MQSLACRRRLRLRLQPPCRLHVRALLRLRILQPPGMRVDLGEDSRYRIRRVLQLQRCHRRCALGRRRRRRRRRRCRRRLGRRRRRRGHRRGCAPLRDLAPDLVHNLSRFPLGRMQPRLLRLGRTKRRRTLAPLRARALLRCRQRLLAPPPRRLRYRHRGYCGLVISLELGKPRLLEGEGRRRGGRWWRWR